ncbi:MAG TPA: hypothetical protein VHO29_14755 [Marmoricola sp.]|nr:hypothetical protein [Marmoricola sp.]
MIEASNPATAAAPRRAKHLIDHNAPRPVRNVRAERESLTRVQQWVMSTLTVTTGLHMAAGLIVAAMFLDARGTVAQVGLNVIAAIFSIGSIAAALAIHKRPWLSPWIALGIIPGIVGIWLTFG